jgi:hypothetical protein
LLIAGGFVCDGLTEVGHHAYLLPAVLRSASELEGRAGNK